MNYNTISLENIIGRNNIIWMGIYLIPTKMDRANINSTLLKKTHPERLRDYTWVAVGAEGKKITLSGHLHPLPLKGSSQRTANILIQSNIR